MVWNFVRKFIFEKAVVDKSIEEIKYDTQVTIYEVRDEFPSLCRLQEITKQETVIISAIGSAIRSLKSHNVNLRNSSSTVRKGGKGISDDLKVLTDLLRSAVDSKI